MTLDGNGHAASIPQSPQSPQMEPDRGTQRLLEEPSRAAQNSSKPLPAREVATNIHGSAQEKKPLDKQSMDYILRTGLAGGLAGCAVGVTISRETLN